MAFIYARAAKAFLESNILVLSADSIDSFHVIGELLRDGTMSLFDARAAYRTGFVAGVILAATKVCGSAHASATTAVRSTAGIRDGRVEGAGHLRAGAAYYYLASMALDTAYSAQQLAIDANRGDTNDGGGTDASVYSLQVQRVVDGMATQS